MKQLFAKFLLLCSLALSLPGCGFHLRGHEPLPPELHVLYLQSADPYDPLTKELRQVLQTIGVIMAQDSVSAPVTLQIINENFSQQLGAQGAGGQLTTYVLIYTLAYQLLDPKDRVIQASQTITSTRNYQVNANQLLGDLSVQESLKEDMRRDLINQLLNRLRSRNTLKALVQT